MLLNLSATKADTTFTPSDYLTVGYYDFIRAGGGTQDLALIATEKKHYEFSATRPTQAAPTSPASLAIEFDPLRSRIGVHSGTSTDPDSLDNSLRYQANISSSGIFAESDWQPLANLAADLSVIFGNTY